MRVLDPDSVDEWISRRASLAQALDGATDAADQSDQPNAEARRRGLSRPSWAVVVALMCVSALVAVLATLTMRPTNDLTATVRTPTPTPSTPDVHDGQDPVHTRCVDDAVVAAARTLPEVGTLELIFSAECKAYWARVTRTDGLSVGYQINVSVEDLNDPTRIEEAVEPNATAAYSFLLFRPDPTHRICALGSVTTEAGTVSFGDRLC